MRFFSVYDIIIYKTQQNKLTIEEMFNFFKNNGIGKNKILSLKKSGIIPEDEYFLAVILKYLNMTRLELELSLHRVPHEYEIAYFENIKKIASLLEQSHSSKEHKVFIEKEPYFQTKYGRLYNGDALELFKTVPDNSIDTIFADPPFNLSKEYDEGVNDSKTYSEYINWCMKWLDECVRVLKPNGSLFIYNVPHWHTYLSAYLNEKLNFWAWIAVDMKFSLPIQNRLYPAHYSLLYYVKGSKPKTYNNQRIPMLTCRHCGGELKDYGGYKNKMNPKGVNLSDVWTDIYPVRHSNTKKRKFNELPVKLLDRVITMSTNKGDTVLDPFGGSGTTFAVSEILERNWIGFEIGNCEIIKNRLENLDNDRLLLEKIYQEKNNLFPDNVRKLRKQNGFWLPEDFDIDDSQKNKNQISLFDTDK